MTMGNIPVVQLYTKDECSLCDKAMIVLDSVAREIPFELIKIDITKDKELFEKFKEKIPVVYINGRISFKYYVEEEKFREKLNKCRLD